MYKLLLIFFFFYKSCEFVGFAIASGPGPSEHDICGKILLVTLQWHSVTWKAHTGKHIWEKPGLTGSPFAQPPGCHATSTMRLLKADIQCFL